MADPTQAEPQKIDPTRPGSKIFDPDTSLESELEAGDENINPLSWLSSVYEVELLNIDSSSKGIFSILVPLTLLE